MDRTAKSSRALTDMAWDNIFSHWDEQNERLDKDIQEAESNIEYF